MTLLRYAPNKNYPTMQDTMNSLVNALFNSDLSDAAQETADFAPRMDMKETENDIQLKLTMPGIDTDKLDISVKDDVLTVKGETHEEEEKTDEKSRWIIREHSHCSYYRSVQLPAQVIAEKAEAEYKNGILSLTLPKAEEIKPKTISVKVSD